MTFLVSTNIGEVIVRISSRNYRSRFLGGRTTLPVQYCRVRWLRRLSGEPNGDWRRCMMFRRLFRQRFGRLGFREDCINVLQVTNRALCFGCARLTIFFSFRHCERGPLMDGEHGIIRGVIVVIVDRCKAIDIISVTYYLFGTLFIRRHLSHIPVGI
jgi:hypothetical protein